MFAVNYLLVDLDKDYDFDTSIYEQNIIMYNYANFEMCDNKDYLY